LVAQATGLLLSHKGLAACATTSREQCWHQRGAARLTTLQSGSSVIVGAILGGDRLNVFGLQGSATVAASSRLLGLHGSAASPIASTGMHPGSAAGVVCSTGSQQWSVTHNDLFVPLPVQSAADTTPPEQQQQLAVLQPASPRGWAGGPSTALALLPGGTDAAASLNTQYAAVIDLQQVGDAALQQVLGISLQELHSGGPQVSISIINCDWSVDQACSSVSTMTESQPCSHLHGHLSMPLNEP
jgi:hypothetical protein